MRITIEPTERDEYHETQPKVSIEGAGNHGSEVAELMRCAMLGYGFAAVTVEEYIPEVPIGVGLAGLRAAAFSTTE